MRGLGAALVVVLAMVGASMPGQVLAASANAKQTNEREPATTGSLPPAAAPSALPKAAAPLRNSYEAIPLTERLSIQSDLIWAGTYNSPINGEYSEQLVAAVKAFQRHNKTRQTGVLNPHERQALVALVRPMQEHVGWQMVYDASTGARIGLPMKLVPHASKAKAGSLWSSAQGQVRIETFRISGRDTTLASVFEQQKNEPVERKIAHEALRGDHFVLIGMQGLKKMHVRAYARNGEIRGITILYDQAMDGTLDPLVPPMAYTFQPFPVSTATLQTIAGPRRKVEYGTGLIVSASGHIVSDLNVTDGCESVIIPGVGNAEKLAVDRAKGLALLRVYGAEDLTPLALLGEPPSGSDLTLVGIVEPQAQAGGAAISTMPVRLENIASIRGTETKITQIPSAGFSGAAAIDMYGRFFGMLGMKPTVVAGSAPAALRATLISAETIRSFMEANYVAPASGQIGIEKAKASVVRVICVRK
jgi:peptidoglycan hydrolase-like protein with peptidoglycan-binding domain